MDSAHATGAQEDELDFGEDDMYVAQPAGAEDDAIRDDESDVVSLPGSPRAAEAERPSESDALPGPPPPGLPAKRAHDPTVDANGNLLPPGWTSRVSSQNDVYYKEEATGKSTWDVPAWPDQRERTTSPEPKKVDQPRPEPDKPSGRLAVHPDRLKLVPLLPTESKHLSEDRKTSAATTQTLKQTQTQVQARPAQTTDAWGRSTTTATTTTTRATAQDADYRSRPSTTVSARSPDQGRRPLPPQSQFAPDLGPPRRERGRRDERHGGHRAGDPPMISSANLVAVAPRHHSPVELASRSLDASNRFAPAPSRTGRSAPAPAPRVRSRSRSPPGAGPRWATSTRARPEPLRRDSRARSPPRTAGLDPKALDDSLDSYNASRPLGSPDYDDRTLALPPQKARSPVQQARSPERREEREPARREPERQPARDSDSTSMREPPPHLARRRLSISPPLAISPHVKARAREEARRAGKPSPYGGRDGFRSPPRIAPPPVSSSAPGVNNWGSRAPAARARSPSPPPRRRSRSPPRGGGGVRWGAPDSYRPSTTTTNERMGDLLFDGGDGRRGQFRNPDSARPVQQAARELELAQAKAMAARDDRERERSRSPPPPRRATLTIATVLREEAVQPARDQSSDRPQASSPRDRERQVSPDRHLAKLDHSPRRSLGLAARLSDNTSGGGEKRTRDDVDRFPPEFDQPLGNGPSSKRRRGGGGRRNR